jgi:hypothetical protein
VGGTGAGGGGATGDGARSDRGNTRRAARQSEITYLRGKKRKATSDHMQRIPAGGPAAPDQSHKQRLNSEAENPTPILTHRHKTQRHSSRGRRRKHSDASRIRERLLLRPVPCRPSVCVLRSASIFLPPSRFRAIRGFSPHLPFPPPHAACRVAARRRAPWPLLPTKAPLFFLPLIDP